MPTDKNIPTHRLLINYLKKGFDVLDQQTQEELITFLKLSQDETGGFTDRAGSPDLYYSLFGSWLAQAAGQDELLVGLASFIKNKDVGNLGVVEQMSLLLIRSDLMKDEKKKSILSLAKLVFQKGRNIHLSYQFFLFTLVVDAAGRSKKLYYFFARIFLIFYKPKTDFPCSLISALVFARKKLGLKTVKLQKQLLEYLQEQGGFKAFLNLQNSDMLSTAVALFALIESSADLRLLKPANLDFIQQNYDSGAFLSGDGDQTRDLEYTFYGLLALGSLTNA